jgi:hypothetical protein
MKPIVEVSNETFCPGGSTMNTIDLIIIIAGVWGIISLPLAILIGRLLEKERRRQNERFNGVAGRQEEQVNELYGRLLYLKKKAERKRSNTPRD